MAASDEHAEIRDLASSDPFCARVGIELEKLDSGYAETTLTIEEDHLNFHGTPHGGAIYSLADAAFAAASNSHGDAAFALETNISYLAAAEVGDTIRAVAEETHLGGRTAEYEVVVSDDSDERIATFRGRVYKPGR
ncbi:MULTISPECIES: hydroxyphenylacetyl-CoA thioesterase PaaI [Haloferax]|uniref:Hydroxyphenylacetyl-CoA thioesterase PaaI n=1 Tax=Haloferax marinum TaxID=2666143 RepID=A0A6A8GDW7_9EURY|nr:MULTISPECIES: hydroxyphenylacetyl-CoA thioesterase PaaI [Haloferax]KAB1191123.1 hydroxyphenylacetyl-CoA thioesterase PaaI [Haloferax sp. CBA1150]MRW98006.1 hydroxyphenylacetyl-CoA thioesterase PaaI [Haloferax marinum]